MAGIKLNREVVILYSPPPAWTQCLDLALTVKVDKAEKRPTLFKGPR